MDNIQEQIRELRETVTRQAKAILELSRDLDALKAQVASGDFETITCKAWMVVDKDGKARIVACTSADGDAGVTWSDKDGKARIVACTYADVEAVVAWYDKDGEERISAFTYAGGDAGVTWSDKDGEERITASTDADGSVNYPTKDGK